MISNFNYRKKIFKFLCNFEVLHKSNNISIRRSKLGLGVRADIKQVFSTLKYIYLNHFQIDHSNLSITLHRIHSFADIKYTMKENITSHILLLGNRWKYPKQFALIQRLIISYACHYLPLGMVILLYWVIIRPSFAHREKIPP